MQSHQSGSELDDVASKGRETQDGPRNGNGEGENIVERSAEGTTQHDAIVAQDIVAPEMGGDVHKEGSADIGVEHEAQQEAASDMELEVDRFMDVAAEENVREIVKNREGGNGDNKGQHEESGVDKEDKESTLVRDEVATQDCEAIKDQDAGPDQEEVRDQGPDQEEVRNQEDPHEATGDGKGGMVAVSTMDGEDDPSMAHKVGDVAMREVESSKESLSVEEEMPKDIEVQVEKGLDAGKGMKEEGGGEKGDEAREEALWKAEDARMKANESLWTKLQDGKGMSDEDESSDTEEDVGPHDSAHHTHVGAPEAVEQTDTSVTPISPAPLITCKSPRIVPTNASAASLRRSANALRGSTGIPLRASVTSIRASTNALLMNQAEMEKVMAIDQMVDSEINDEEDEEEVCHV